MTGKILKYLIFLILFLTSSNIFDSRDNYISRNEVDMNSFIKDMVSDSIESDTDVIDKYFTEGMSIDDIKSLLTNRPKDIKSTGKYEPIYYDFSNMLHYKDIEEMLYNMNRLDIVNLEQLYKTVDDRYIYGIEIGKGNKVIYIDAGIHAGEVGNTVILMQFLSEILNEYYTGNKDIINKLNNVKLAIIPCINPDGYEIYNFGKKSINNKNLWIYENYDILNIEHLKSNANGVDINRNFPSQTGGLLFKKEKIMKSVAFDKSTKAGKHFPGYSLGSEQETKSCIYFMLKHYRNMYAYIDMHSQGRVIYNGKPNLSKEFNNLSRKFAKYISSYNKYKVHGLSAEEVGRGNDGTATDFMAELAHGFKFCLKTGRLCSSSYIDNHASLMYNYPVITMESLTTYTRDVELFKTEYYDKKLRDILYDMLDGNFIK